MDKLSIWYYLYSYIKEGFILFHLSNTLLSTSMQVVVSSRMHNNTSSTIRSPFLKSEVLRKNVLSKYAVMKNNFEAEIENYTLKTWEKCENWNTAASNAYMVSIILAWIMIYSTDSDLSRKKIDFCKIHILHWLSIMMKEIDESIIYSVLYSSTVSSGSSVSIQEGYNKSENDIQLKEADFIYNNFIKKLYGIVPVNETYKNNID